jgi:hypothetical protein
VARKPANVGWVLVDEERGIEACDVWKIDTDGQRVGQHPRGALMQSVAGSNLQFLAGVRVRDLLAAMKASS